MDTDTVLMLIIMLFIWGALGWLRAGAVIKRTRCWLEASDQERAAMREVETRRKGERQSEADFWKAIDPDTGQECLWWGTPIERESDLQMPIRIWREMDREERWAEHR